MLAVGLALKCTNTKRLDSVINITGKILPLPLGSVLWQKQKTGRKVHCLPQTAGQISNVCFLLLKHKLWRKEQFSIGLKRLSAAQPLLRHCQSQATLVTSL